MKLVVAAPDGSQNRCHRPVQKIIPFEIVNDPKESNVDEQNTDDPVVKEPDYEDTFVGKRPTRKAAREGQLMRKLRDRFG